MSSLILLRKAMHLFPQIMQTIHKKTLLNKYLFKRTTFAYLALTLIKLFVHANKVFLKGCSRPEARQI